MKKYLLLTVVTSLIFYSVTQAEITLPKIIGSNMVLQRNKPVPIWGFASPAEKIKVKFGKQQKKTSADNSGKWEIILDPMPASDQPAKMIISGKNTITLENILVGEVWLCSGQSNMEYPVKRFPSYKGPAQGNDIAEEELKKPANPQIRLFLVEKKLSLPDVTSKGWRESCDTTIASFSAAGYFFGKELFDELHVPIGMIASDWGGSRIEPWTPAKAYEESPLFKDQTSQQPLIIDGIAAGKNYQSMIFPLAPFAIRGFLWYQGESNCMLNETFRYTEKMQLLINSWRNVWNDSKLPFYYVQIAPYYYTKRKDKNPHTPETLAEFWEAQSKALSIPYTGMAVVTDLVDNLAEIHPSYKWIVGKRLAAWALAKDYGRKDMEYSGPMYQSMKVNGNKIEIEFSHTGKGLVSKDGKTLSWFSVAGADKNFVPAEATIEGNQVVVSASGVDAPVAVRFAWDEKAMPNFFNSDGFPAIPFRTDGPEWIPGK